MFALPLLPLLLATTGLALPRHQDHGRHHAGRASTLVPGSVLQSELPSGQTQLVSPNTTAVAVAVGVGNQNYTCTSAGTYSSIGAFAQLFDISGLNGTPTFSTITQSVHDAWVANPSTNPLDPTWLSQAQSQFSINPVAVHTFVEFNGAADPHFDFSESTSNPASFFTGKKAGDIPAPTDPSTNVDWLHLTSVDPTGIFASDVFRTETVGGQPPAKCTGTGTITVKYAAQYWFFL